MRGKYLLYIYIYIYVNEIVSMVGPLRDNVCTYKYRKIISIGKSLPKYE
jgi:hypothetical protein